MAIAIATLCMAAAVAKLTWCRDAVAIDHALLPLPLLLLLPLPLLPLLLLPLLQLLLCCYCDHCCYCHRCCYATIATNAAMYCCLLLLLLLLLVDCLLLLPAVYVSESNIVLMFAANLTYFPPFVRRFPSVVGYASLIDGFPVQSCP